MPSPYLSLSFETIEARHWATELINNVFTTSSSSSSPSHDQQPTLCLEKKPLPPPPTLYEQFKQQEVENNYFYTPDKRLFNEPTTTPIPPLLSSSSDNNMMVHLDFSLTPSLNSLSTSGSSSSASSSSTTSSVCDQNSISCQSDPGTTFISSTTSTSTSPCSSPRISRRNTLTKHLKRHLTLDDLPSSPTLTSPLSSSPSIRKLFSSEQIQRERKACLIWRETLHNYLLDPHFYIPTPRLSKNSPRFTHCIVSELLATEETYLGHLVSFKQMFIEPFLLKFQNRYMIRDLQIIFTYIPSLITLSNALIRRWRAFIEGQSYFDNHYVTVKDNHHIGKSFCELEDEFKVYTYYAAHYGKAQRCISKMERKPNYQQWIHAVLQNKDLQRMGLADFLISPIQRITRYCLLVKDLLKHSDGNDVELERTYKYLTALASAMNNCQ
ncbi:Dbl homology domain-containing protein [Cunninghamella echinulata]|nr:Dbl homology domain-containing protein [Cunninghamella echinulata]